MLKLETVTEEKIHQWLVESGSPYITRRTAQARLATLEGEKERERKIEGRCTSQVRRSPLRLRTIRQTGERCRFHSSRVIKP